MPRRFTLWLLACVITSGLCAQSFQQQIVENDKSLSDIQMVSASVGYAGGVEGIYKTADQGQTWTLLPFFQATGNVNQDFYTLNFNVIHLHFFNELHGIAYGWHSLNNEIVTLTTDGGVTWSVTHIHAPETSSFSLHHLNSLYAWDNMNVIIVGNSGRILRSTDGGAHWSGAFIHETQPNLVRVQFTSPTTGYAAGEYGKFFYTSDGGVHWSVRSLTFTITDFHFFNSHEGLALADEGFFYTTSDGGASWTKGSMEAEGSWTRLAFADSNVGYALGTSGLIYKTTDGGESWLRVHADANEITSASLISTQLIWFSTSHGYLLHSTNGGSVSTPAPALSSVNPPSGAIGNVITLTGTSFRSVTGLLFNGVPAHFKVSGESTLTATVPRGATTGKIGLRWPGGSVLSAANFVISEAPQLYAPSPNAIPRGTTVILQGENLQHITRLTIGGLDFPFTILTPKEISLYVPPDYPLFPAASVTVFSPFGNATVALSLSGKPKVTNTAAAGAPGKSVIVTGENLLFATDVKFGSVSVSYFEVINSTQINCKVPDVASMQVAPISVVTPDGTATSVGLYTIYVRPEILSVSPLSLQVGEELKIEGNNLPRGPFFGRVWFNQYEVSPTDIRYEDEHALYVKVPSLLPGQTNLAISVANEGNLKDTENFAITITGTIPNKIDQVEPISVSGPGIVIVKGVFPFIDSLTVNGVKHTLHDTRPNYVAFFTKAGTTTGVITLYDNGVPFSYPHELTITSNPSPRISFSPKIASPGMKIALVPVNVRFINSIRVNGKSVPFDPSYSMGYIYNVSFTVTDNLTSGRVSIVTPDGVYETADVLQIKPSTQVGPIIGNIEHVDQSTGYFLKITGFNFSGLTDVRFDQFPVAFTVQNDTVVLVERPQDPASISVSLKDIIVTSPAGQDSRYYGAVFYPVQPVISFTPATAKRGSFITVTLGPKTPYLTYDNHYHFYFGTTSTQRWERVDDNTYRVEVPREGRVEGKIGVGSASTINFSNSVFTLAEDGYCDSRGANTTFPLKRLMVQGKVITVPNDPYIDNSSAVLEVIPGQPLRLGVTPSKIGVMSKIFIDWNGNKEFDEPGLLMVDGNALPRLDSMIYTILTVPPSAIPGTEVRMRIVSRLYDQQDLLPCGLRFAGQVIDYDISILAPSSTLKVYDFYPSIGTTNTVVTVVGDDLDALQSVTLHGVPLSFGIINSHTAQLTIPSGATAGNFVFNTSTQTVTTTRAFRIDPTIVPPVDPLQDLNYIYRATVNGKDVAFWYVFTEGVGYQVFPVAEFPVNGILCVYTPGGEFCFPDPLSYMFHIDYPNPFMVKAGQPVSLTGTNLAGISQLMITETGETIPFTATETSLTFIAPESNVTSRTLRITGYGVQEVELVYESTTPACDHYTGWNEGAEIVSVKFNQISNTSAKNVTGGRADYSGQVAIVDRYHSYYTDVVVKNFSNQTRFVTITVIINGGQDLGSNFTNHKVGASEGIILEPNQEAVLHPYFPISENIPLNQELGCWFLLEYYSFSGCESLIGEIEKYSIFVKENPPVSSLQISSINKTTTLVNEEIEVTGTDLDAVETLKLGDLYTSFTIVSPSRLRFTVPLQAETGKVTVTSRVSEAQSSAVLQVVHPHTVTSIEPPYGKTGDVIVLHGTHLANVTSILFDDVPAESFWLQNSNAIRLKIPPTAKTGPLRLKNTFGEEVSSATFYHCDGVSPNLFCKAGQQITFSDLAPAVFGQQAFELTAFSSSSLPVSYTSSNSAVATISGNTISIVGVGTAIITASQPGNTSYNPALTVQKTLVVNKADQVVTFHDLQAMRYGAPAFTLTAISSSSLPVSYKSSNPSVATIAGNTVTIMGVGSTVITASQPGNGSYKPALSVQKSLVVNKADQVVTFNDLQVVRYGNGPLSLTATSSSSLPVSFTSSDLSVATIHGNTLTILGAGSTIITASQPGNSFFTPAVSVQKTFVVDKADAFIQFDNLPQKTYNDVAFDLSATSLSALPISYSSSDPSVANIVGSTVSIFSAGNTTITASHPGNANFNAASRSQVLTVNKSNQLITFPKPPATVMGALAFELTATADSGLPILYASSNPTIAEINGNTLTAKAPGITTLTASQAGNGNYNAAVSVSHEFVVAPITSIEAGAKSSVKLYPNPSSGILMIEVPFYKDMAVDVRITNVMGKLLGEASFIADDAPIQFDLTGLPPGVYFVTISLDGVGVTHRISRI
jgi:photosystem II stability/assembly factor-like uncharacterized protein